MAVPRRNQNRRSGRRPAFRDPRPVILVLCEGRKTEPTYLHGFVQTWQNACLQVRYGKPNGVPFSLVQRAKQLKDHAAEEERQKNEAFIAFDSVWCVCDVDDHPRLREAMKLARDAGIEMAVSNPCFELWLLLHFRESPGARDRADISRMLRAFIPGYTKVAEYTPQLHSAYLEASERARRMWNEAIEADDAERNPLTGVFRLTELIRTGKLPQCDC